MRGIVTQREIVMEDLIYQTGFGSHFETEAVDNSLPIGQNSPQKPPHGLYAEQLSGSAFTTPRHQTLRSWLYRIRPSVGHSEFTKVEHAYIAAAPFNNAPTNPTQCRWEPLPYPDEPTNFIQGLRTYAGHGSAASMSGAAIHLYAINQSMQNNYFYNSDGEMLIVPQEGSLRFKTEMGLLDVAPKEIIVIPRGIKFQVELIDEKARGYICENFGAPYTLPELGPIGANGLANPRDFLYPTAHYEESQGDFELITKFQGHLWKAKTDHSPINVVAWHGNYAPYKYDLTLFNTMNTVSFDHPDPSIFTVLTSQTNTPGVANVDFAIFPSRWMVAENTFRPPYYHRNIMSEFMGLIYGVYDAKENGFNPGGASLHNCMSAHGPDKKTFEQATDADLKPQYYHGTLAFMFESCFVWQPTEFAMGAGFRQRDYLGCWEGLDANFNDS